MTGHAPLRILRRAPQKYLEAETVCSPGFSRNRTADRCPSALPARFLRLEAVLRTNLVLSR